LRETSRDNTPARAALAILAFVVLAAICLIGKSAVEARRDTAGSLGLVPRGLGKPLNTLFVFGPAAGNRMYLARFFDMSPKVELFELTGQSARDALDFPRPAPSYMLGGDRGVLVKWASAASGTDVNRLVEVDQHCWPVFAVHPGLDSKPLTEISAVYPGRVVPTGPSMPSVSRQALEGSLRTDSRTSSAQVLAMLGRIEGARRTGMLQEYAYDGSETVGAVEGRAGLSREESLAAMLDGWGFDLKVKPPANPLHAGNRVVVLEPGSARGKLPAAVPVTVINRGNPSLPRVALTIDDGWDADMRILDLLAAWKIRFTAFPIGEYAASPQGQQLVKRIYDMGGEVCSHTWSHKSMRKMPDPQMVSEIWRAADAVCSLTHEVYPYVRFYGGDYDVPAVNVASREGFWVVNWTVDTLDTKKGLSTDQRVANVLANLKPGAIILCHFGGMQTYDLLAKLIPQIQARGYEVTTLSGVLQGTPFTLE
jgi:peptidoglycan/xylan/chitin deacetylase (PgdA/CDA1 family)